MKNRDTDKDRIMYTCIAVTGLIISLFITKNTLSRTHEETKVGLDAQQSSKEARAQDKREKHEEQAKKSMEKRMGSGEHDLEMGSQESMSNKA